MAAYQFNFIAYCHMPKDHDELLRLLRQLGQVVPSSAAMREPLIAAIAENKALKEIVEALQNGNPKFYCYMYEGKTLVDYTRAVALTSSYEGVFTLAAVEPQPSITREIGEIAGGLLSGALKKEK